MLLLRCLNLLKGKKFPSSFPKNNSSNDVTNVLNVNLNVAKDVILFKYDNPKYFKYMNFFGLSQFGIWLYLSHTTYTLLRDAPVSKEKSEDDPWWQKLNLGENKYRNTIAATCAIIGYLMLVFSWTYTLKSVRYLVLRKGGKSLSFVTYTPFGENRIMDVPIDMVSAQESRRLAKVHLPIKVQGKWFHYMLDMKGEFTNKQLFDVSAGLKRKLF